LPRIRFTLCQDTQEHTRSNDPLLTWHALNRDDNDLMTRALHGATIYFSIHSTSVFRTTLATLPSQTLHIATFARYIFDLCHCHYYHDPRQTPFVSGPLPHSRPQQPTCRRYPPYVSPHPRPQNQTHPIIKPILSHGLQKPSPLHLHPRHVQAENPSVNIWSPRSPSLVCLDPRQERSMNKTCLM